ncbi:MAG: hypothetical protein EXR78_00935 [Deltaproteobacteria bacterium]|nr:hypothetical protein [Deltaproteobacteria bacterium]
MADSVNNAPEEQSLEKVIWGYVGTGVLWISLLLTGLAFERLGISSNILSGVLPGEIGTLREQSTTCTRDLGIVKNERDSNKLTENALRVEIGKLKNQLASAQPSTPSATAPTQPTTPTP